MSPRSCFTYQGKPISWELTNSAWHTALEKAGIEDFRFDDLMAYLGIMASEGRDELR